MTMRNSIIVNAPADDVWKLIGQDFVDVARWMAAIPRSEVIPGPARPGAPAKGRNSYLIKKFNGMYQEEIITAYDDAGKSLSMYAAIKNGPFGMPLKGYDSRVTVEAINGESCRVHWDSNAHVRLHGYLLWPVMKKPLDAGFIRNLEEIKHIMETGQPHPRKVEKMEAEALAPAPIPA